jgi:basic membrane lipoprotein Med (substrate-binding protein (PBP1-ABC) superfamily)
MRLIVTLAFAFLFWVAAPGQETLCTIMAKPDGYLSKTITLTAQANIFAGGTLLTAAGCADKTISMQYVEGYEKWSDAAVIKLLQRLQQDAHDGQFMAEPAPRVTGTMALEGTFEKNPRYHAQVARGDATLASWDAAYQYCFRVTRVPPPR